MILTRLHRTANAIRFKRSVSDNIWVVLGGTSPWQNDQNPPVPNPSVVSINSPVTFVKAIVRYVKEDPTGGFVFIDPSGTQRYFKEVQDENQVLSDFISVVMVQATINGVDIPAPSIREVGFVTGLEPIKGFEGRSKLTPDQISRPGVLETVEYRVPINVLGTSTYAFSYLTEF
jgi:hypothetical protein